MPWKMVLLVVVMMATVLAIDLALPLGVAGGVPYVTVVLLGWWLPNRLHIIFLAVISTGLTLIGYIASPEGGIPWMVFTNRFLALFAIWVAAILLVMAKNAYKEVEESDRRLKNVLDIVPSMINVKDPDHRYVLANKYQRDFFGFGHKDWIGQTSKLISPEHGRRQHEADCRVLETGEMIPPYENVVTNAEGESRVILVTKVPLRDLANDIVGVVTSSVDITEPKNAEEMLARARDELECRVEERTRQLNESQNRLHDVAETSFDRFWETDEHSRFTYRSTSFGPGDFLPRDSIMGRTRWEVVGVDPDKDERWRKHVDDHLAHRAFRDFQFVHVRDDGRRQHVSVSGRPFFDEDGTFLGYRGSATDISERKALEDQLIQADKLVTLGTLAAGTAHELSQPLNILRLVAEGARLDAQPGNEASLVQAEDVQTIIDQVERMATIIDHMSVFSRRDKEDLAPISLHTAISNALSLIAPQCATTDIEFDLHIDGAARTVMGSGVQFEQVILNLLTNAKFAVDEQAQKSMESGQAFVGRIGVRLMEEDADGSINITVSDNGGGIPDAILGNIFDPFFTTKDIGSGTGLGLSISHTIIDTMGGRIEIQNKDGGACFTIVLPNAGGADAT